MQIKHVRITRVDILVHKTTHMLGLHQGQCVLLCEKCRKNIYTIDGMLDTIKELHFYCFCSWQYNYFLKIIKIKFKGSTTNYDPDACWYIIISHITSLRGTPTNYYLLGTLLNPHKFNAPLQVLCFKNMFPIICIWKETNFTNSTIMLQDHILCRLLITYGIVLFLKFLGEDLQYLTLLVS